MKRSTFLFIACGTLAMSYLLISSTVMAQTAPTSGLSITQAVVARTVEGHQAQGTEGPFESSLERLYYFLDVSNTTGAEQVLTVVWQKQGSERRFEVTVTIGTSASWRTWAVLRVSPRRAGTWHVEVKNADGVVLSSQDFVIQ